MGLVPSFKSTLINTEKKKHDETLSDAFPEKKDGEVVQKGQVVVVTEEP